MITSLRNQRAQKLDQIKKQSLQIIHLCLEKTLLQVDATTQSIKDTEICVKLPVKFRFHDFYRHPREHAFETR
jgi:hypothetical protein